MEQVSRMHRDAELLTSSVDTPSNGSPFWGGIVTAAAHWDILKQDLRYTARTLTRARGFAATAILVTAIGVGANTAAISVADFVLLRPFPFPAAEALVQVCEGPREGGGWGCMNQLSPANYRDLKTRSRSFEDIGVFTGGAVNLVGGAEPRRLAITQVTPEVLPVLGVRPTLGRVFDARSPDDISAIVISYGLWQSQFAGNPGVLGQTVNLDGASYTIIGVMPRAFYFPSREPQLWTFLNLRAEDFADRTNSFLTAVGRLAPGVTFEQARSELSTLAEQLARQYPDTNAETGVSVYRTRDNMAPRFRLMLISLGGASLCFLLLTCANLANLLLARAAAHDREFAVRAALGAGKLRMVRQLTTQSIVLTSLGGALGVVIAAATVPLFSALVPPTLPVETQPTVDLRMLGVAALFTALTSIGFGLFPALRVGRTGFAALRDGSRTSGGRRQRLRAVLVALELAMSVVLLISAGLLIRAVWRVQSVDPGFASRNVLTLQTALPRPKYDNPVRRKEFYDRVLTGIRALPGVQGAAVITGLPMVWTGLITRVDVAGQDVRSARSRGVSHRWVTPQYFQTMGIPLLRGRDIEDADTGTRPWVAVVSASFAERYWPGQDPVGKTFGHLDRTRTVVGVVGDVKVRGLERTSEPQMYLPAPQAPDNMPAIFDPKDLVIRHSGQDPAALLSAVRLIVRTADPTQPISGVRSMDVVVAGETASRRAQLEVLGSLAVVALLLSGIGIYGLLAYTVSQRSQEIGIRLALGADHARVGRMIFADGMRLAAVGIVPGVLGAYASGRGMSTLLFGVAPGDPVTFAVGVGLVLAIALAGCILPTLRAVAVTPMSALRAE
jgi:predicted permease